MYFDTPAIAPAADSITSNLATEQDQTKFPLNTVNLNVLYPCQFKFISLYDCSLKINAGPILYRANLGQKQKSIHTETSWQFRNSNIDYQTAIRFIPKKIGFPPYSSLFKGKIPNDFHSIRIPKAIGRTDIVRALQHNNSSSVYTEFDVKMATLDHKGQKITLNDNIADIKEVSNRATNRATNKQLFFFMLQTLGRKKAASIMSKMVGMKLAKMKPANIGERNFTNKVPMIGTEIKTPFDLFCNCTFWV